MDLGDVAMGVLLGTAITWVGQWLYVRRHPTLKVESGITTEWGDETCKRVIITMHPAVEAELQKLAKEMGDIGLTELFKQGIEVLKIVREKRDGELLIKQGNTLTEINLNELPRRPPG